jgi:peroxisomal membrane protein 4
MFVTVCGRLFPPIVENNNNDVGSMNSTRTQLAGYPLYPHHAWIAGAIGGYFVWGRYTSINYQIVLYLTSRVIVGLFQRYVIQGRITKEKNLSNVQTKFGLISKYISDRMYSFGAATIWGIVMYLFEDSPEVLHPSLKGSMDEIYRFRSWSSINN